MLIKFKGLLEKLKITEEGRASKGQSSGSLSITAELLELMECIPGIVSELSNEVSKKASSDGIVKALALKANTSDVNEGFTKIKSFIEAKSGQNDTESPPKKFGKLESTGGSLAAQISNFVTPRELKNTLADYVKHIDLEDTLAEFRAQAKAASDEAAREADALVNKISAIGTNFELRFSELSDALKTSVEDAIIREQSLSSKLEKSGDLKYQTLIKVIEQRLAKDLNSSKPTKSEEQLRKSLDTLQRELSDFKRLFEQQQTELTAKLDNNIISTRNQYNAFKSEIISTVSGYATKANEEVVFQEIYGHIKRFQGDLGGIKETLKAFEKDHEKRVEDMTDAIELSKRLRKEVAALQKRIEEQELQSGLKDRLSKAQTDLTEALKVIQPRLEGVEASTSKLQKSVETGLNTADLLTRLAPDILAKAAAQTALKTDKIDAELNRLANELRSIQRGSASKSSASRSPQPAFQNGKQRTTALSQKLPEPLQKIKNLKKIVDQKADLKEICSLLDQKADVNDVNQLIKPIHDELDSLPSAAELNFLQTSLKSSLPLLLTEAMYIWKHGGLREKVVQWDIESHNYRPQHFTLTRNNCVIEVKEEGLYQISFGFYGRLKAVVDLQLNGELMLTTEKLQMNTASQKFENAHSNGYVIGTLNRHNSR